MASMKYQIVRDEEMPEHFRKLYIQMDHLLVRYPDDDRLYFKPDPFCVWIRQFTSMESLWDAVEAGTFDRARLKRFYQDIGYDVKCYLELFPEDDPRTDKEGA